ncbi:MAG: zf-HC2 domain-containing protein [Actinomycetota bacterium]
MNSTHPEIETISAYLDGMVTSRERAQVEQHLASCGSCGEITRRMKTASGNLAALGKVQMTAQEQAALRRTLLGATKTAASGAWGFGGRPAGVTSRRWSSGRLQWSLGGAFALLAVAVVGFAFMRSVPNTDGGAQTLTEAMAPADRSAAPITIASDDQIKGTVLALPEVKGSISKSTAESGPPQAAPEAPALARTDASRDSAAAQSNDDAESFATGGGDDGGGGIAGGGGAYAGAATDAQPFTVDAGAACSAAITATQPDSLEEIAAREISYKGRQAWLIVYGVPAGSGGSFVEITTFVVDPADCANLSGEALERSFLSRYSFKP